KSGGFKTLPVRDAPSDVVKLALKATGPIGDGLYGVDLKQVGDRVVVIEMNDNPSIDAGVEDEYLGEDLYRRIMDEFLRRLERKIRRGCRIGSGETGRAGARDCGRHGGSPVDDARSMPRPDLSV